MEQDINNYVVSIKVDYIEPHSNYGTGIIINNHTILTAQHVIKQNDYCASNIKLKHESFEVELNVDEVDFNYENHCCIITLKNPIEKFNFPDLKNIYTEFSCSTRNDNGFQIYGYLGTGDNINLNILYAKSCYKHIQYGYVLNDIIPQYYTNGGMSGSPVVMNNMVVGILQAEGCVNGCSVNLYFRSLKFLNNYLLDKHIVRNVYGNKIVEKNDYSDSMNDIEYIDRSIDFKFNNKTSDDIHINCSLLDFISRNENHLIMLLGDAGDGKSIELKHLAVTLSNEKNEIYPFHKDLRRFNNIDSLDKYFSSISEYVNDGVNVCLILDAYDEIADENFRKRDFPNYIRNFFEEHKDNKLNIIISSRENYYVNKPFGTDNLITAHIVPLKDNDIKQYVLKKSVKYDDFIKEVKTKELSTLLYTPFYLNYIVQLYNKNSVLPNKSDLVDKIIEHLLGNQSYQKYSTLDKITRENTLGIVELQKIAATFILLNKNFLSADNLYQLIDGKIDSNKCDLIKCTGLLTKNDDDNYSFVHKIFCEFLSAQFFNEKYKNKFDALIYEISYLQNTKIRLKKKYINMLSFLIQLQEDNRLKNWIIDNCPENFDILELDNDEKYHLFVLLLDDTNKKGYYQYYDNNFKISDLICSKKCIKYLLKLIINSTSDIELFNAIRLLQEIKDDYGCQNDIEETLISFLNSNRGNSNHYRDSINALINLDIHDECITNFLFEKYSDANDEQIRRGLYQYILKNHLEDRFIKLLVHGLFSINEDAVYPDALFACFKHIKSKSSFLYLFDNIENIKFNNIYSYSFNEKYINDFVNNLINSYKTDDETYLYQIIDALVLISKKKHLKTNIFKRFFNETKTDKKAFNKLLELYEKSIVEFQILAHDLTCYDDCLMNLLVHNSNKYRELLRYCIRAFDKKSQQRSKFLNEMKRIRYAGYEEDINYITYGDDYSDSIELKKVVQIDYIFNFEKFKQAVQKLLDELNNNNATLKELNEYLYSNYDYKDSCNVILDLLIGKAKLEDIVIDFINDLQTDQDKKMLFFVQNLSNFINNNSNFKKFINEENASKVKDICINNFDKLYSYNNLIYKDDLSIHFNIINLTTSYMSNLILNFDVPLSKMQLLKLLYFPVMEKGNSQKFGFSNNVIDKLSSELISDEIVFYLDNNMANGILFDNCLTYCEENCISLIELDQAAHKVIIDNKIEMLVNHCIRYLFKNKKYSNVIDTITSNKSYINILIDNIECFVMNLKKFEKSKLTNLISYCQNAFNVLYKAYFDPNKDDKWLNNINSNWPSLLRFELDEDNIKDRINIRILAHLRALSKLLIAYGSEECIDLYLDDMIKNKSYCFFETNSFDPMIKYIDSECFLHKLLEISKLIINNEFIDDEVGTSSILLSDIKTCVINILKKNPIQNIKILNSFEESETIEVKRFLSLVKDQLDVDLNQGEFENLNLENAKKFVFNN